MTIALTTRRSFLAGLFVAPALIAAPKLMRVSAAAFDFWVRYQSWPVGERQPEHDWQTGLCPYNRFRTIKDVIAEFHPSLTWSNVDAPAPRCFGGAAVRVAQRSVNHNAKGHRSVGLVEHTSYYLLGADGRPVPIGRDSWLPIRGSSYLEWDRKVSA